ncbi:MAG TPA: hypothetical protein VF589_01260, partial [Allosphingosinicella sp.]|jgi:hypothetical protein
MTAYARNAGCSDYLDVDPHDIDVSDLDPAAMRTWTADQWVRACRSEFMAWLERARGGPAPLEGPGAPLCFVFNRDAARAAAEAGYDPTADPKTIRTDDLEPRAIWSWTEDQLARAWQSGLLGRLPRRVWEDLAAVHAAREAAR